MPPETEVPMAADVQVFATISASTKEKLERFTEQLGLKQDFVVEQALLSFMEAHGELPDEASVPARTVLDDEAFDQLVAAFDAPAAPTARLVELMRG